MVGVEILVQILWILVLAVDVRGQATSEPGEKAPSFDVPVVNVTVVEGATAVLPCSVSHLGRHKVVWTDQWSTLLSYEDQRIIDDERFSVDRPFPSDWNLHVHDIKHSDQGIYSCQVNTTPVKVQTVVLNVLVPPRITGSLPLSDVSTQEGQSVTLMCNVTGIPRPTVTWFRQPTSSGSERESEFCRATSRIGNTGEVLVIHNITRYCAGHYECVADNGVPPSVRRGVHVQVKFSPEVTLPTTRMGQVRGKDTILECVVTAFPQAVSVWEFRGREISSSHKYHVEVFEEDQNELTMSLRINYLDAHDYGEYTCIASNAMGKASETMVLYEHIETTRPPPSTSSLLPWQRSWDRGSGRGGNEPPLTDWGRGGDPQPPPLPPDPQPPEVIEPVTHFRPHGIPVEIAPQVPDYDATRPRYPDTHQPLSSAKGLCTSRSLGLLLAFALAWIWL